MRSANEPAVPSWVCPVHTSYKTTVLPFRYFTPGCLEEAVRLLQEHHPDAAVLAGGTDLIVGLRDGKKRPRCIVDVKRARDLPATITEADGRLTISATATMSDIQKHDTVRRCFPALSEAAAVVGSIQIRHRATLVGNVCNASPAADTVPVLAVYGSAVTLLGPSGERRVPAVEFIQGNRRTALAAGELATAVTLPCPQQPFGAAFIRITRRRGVDLATVNLCCGIDDAGVTTLAFGAVSARPLLVQDPSGTLADPSAPPATKAAALEALIAKASPITDVRASADYRLAMLRVLTERALPRAALRLKEAKMT